MDKQVVKSYTERMCTTKLATNRKSGLRPLFKSSNNYTALSKDDNKKIDKIDKDLDEYLYDVKDDKQKLQADSEEMYNRIKGINATYGGLISSENVLEFLTQNELINLNKLNRQTKKINDLNRDNKLLDKETMNEILANMNAAEILNAEKDRITRYSDYRLIDAYIPQVSKCINVFRDSILSPDNNDCNDVTISYKLSVDDDVEREKVKTKVDDLKKELEFYKKFKKWIRSGLVDGDTFVTVLKCDKEINSMILNESLNYVTSEDNKILTEEELFSEYEIGDHTILEEVFKDDIEKILKESTTNTKDRNNSDTNSTLNVTKSYLNSVKKQLSNAISNNIICMKDAETDMKYGNYSKDAKISKPVVLPGCILKTLPPESTVKLSLDDDVCIGYLYFEKYDSNAEYGREGFGLNVRDLLSASMGGDAYMSSGSSSVGQYTSSDGSSFYMSSTASNLGLSDGTNSSDYFNSMTNNGRNPIKDKFITELFAKGISKKLDKPIIEKNQQFKEIIYQLVKRDYLINKKVKIVFYSAEEVFHYRPDGEGVYGNSKISKVYFYCKMFLSTLLTTVMQKISRGRDKRVLYVETGLDDDIEDAIQEVVRDFKTKEISSDVLKSVTTVLKRVGAFEDYYIPRVDGEAPLDFETISGMDVNLDDDFNNFLMRSIISGMGVPATFADQSNEIDFSRELIMQNSSFVREVVSMQIEAAKFGTEVFQQCFKYQYWDELGLNKNVDVQGKKVARRAKRKKNSLILDVEKLQVELPVPEFLNLNIVNEQIQNYQTKIDFVCNTIYPDELMNEDQSIAKEKAVFRKKYTMRLVKGINWEEIEELIKETKIELNRNEIADKANKDANSSGEDDSSDLDGMDDML